MAKRVDIEFQGKDNVSPTVKRMSRNTVNDIKQIETKVNKSSESMAAGFKKLGGAMAAVFGISAIASYTKGVIDYADKIQKLSIQIGVATQTLDKLNHVANLSGITLDSIVVSIRQMSKNLVDASHGIGEARDAFKQLNINVEDLIKMKPEEALSLVLDRIKEVGSATERTALAMRIMGESGGQLLRIDGGLSGQLAGQNSSLTKERADTLARFNDTMEEFNKTMKELAIEVLPPLADVIIEMAATLGIEVTKTLSGVNREIERLEADLEKAKKHNESVKVFGVRKGRPVSDIEADLKKLYKTRDELLLKSQRDDEKLAALEGKKATLEKQRIENLRKINELMTQQNKSYEKWQGLKETNPKQYNYNKPFVEAAIEEWEKQSDALFEENKLIRDQLPDLDKQIELQKEKIKNKKEEAEATKNANLQREKEIEQQKIINELNQEAVIAQSAKNDAEGQHSLALKEAEERQRQATKAEEEYVESLRQTFAFTEENKTVIEEYGAVFQSVYQRIGDAFAGFIMGTRGAADAFRDMANAIISDLARMAIKSAENSLFQNLIGPMIQGAIGYFTGGYTATGASDFGASRLTAGGSVNYTSGNVVNLGVQAANGAVIKGGIKAFASGGTVNAPTLGLIGEGKYNEAVVPLPDGKKIPVDMKGGGGITVVNNIKVEGSAGGSDEDRRKLARQTAREVEKQVEAIIAKNKRPGGLLYGGV